jgi:glycosyltransferase involved in cell wall biosynthesis
MIEAMACGTPVIAYPRGSVPELVEHGVSGFIVGDEREAAHAVVAASALSRSRCRHYFERRFSAARMCADYLAKYEDVLFPEPVLSTAGLSSSQPMAGNRIPSLFRQDFDLDEV